MPKNGKLCGIFAARADVGQRASDVRRQAFAFDECVHTDNVM